MKKNLRDKLLFLALIFVPGLILILLYLHFDPFQVIKKYDTYTYFPIEPNRDFISTQNYLTRQPRYEYNSFIFGSSRATSFDPDSWIKYLDTGSIPYCFDAAGESIFGIYTKLKFLDGEKADIKNVLILFCRGAFSKFKNHNDHLGVKHPKVSGESWFKFHFIFIETYLNLKFLLGYYSFLFTQETNFFTKGIIEDKGITIDPISNHIRMNLWENQLKKDKSQYYESRRNIFYKRKGEMFESDQSIQEIQLKMLTEIKEILERNHTNYRIILSPVYDQIKFSAQDKKILIDLFRENLYDFTGENFITINDTNWYEIYHFRPFIADTILNIVYSSDSISDKWR